MKLKELIIAIIILTGNNLVSQVLFSHSFNNLSLQSFTSGNSVSLYTTTPGVFSLINDNYANNAGSVNLPNTPFHVPALKNSGWAVSYNSTLNDTFLVSTSWLDDAGLTSDKWIITPTVNVGANTVLTWLAMSPDHSFPDGYEVYGTNKAGNLTPLDFTVGDRLFSLPDGQTAGGGEDSIWKRRSVSLGIFEGQTLRFAFRNNSKNMYQLWIDDIEIRNTFYKREIELTSLETEKYFLINTNQSLGVKVKSLGSVTINTIVLNYQFGNSSVESQTFTINNGLNYLQEENLKFPLPYAFSSPGCYQVKAWLVSVNGVSDQNAGSDTLKMNVTAQSSSPQKNILFEQFVSAYDGESPDAQQKSWAFQSDRIISVNVYDGDSLEETTSSGLINSYKKSSSTAMVDRVYQSEFKSNTFDRYYYESKLSKRLTAVSPVSISVLNKTYDAGTRALSFTIKADFVGEVKGDYRINAYLIENNVCGKSGDTTVNGFNQLSNYYNVPWSPYYQKGYYSSAENAWVLDAWKYKHHNVLIHSFDGSFGAAGVIPVSGGTSGQSYQSNYTLTLPTSTNGAFRYNPENIYIVGFVAEYDTDLSRRNVLNVSKVKLNASSEVVGVSEFKMPLKFGVYPSPSSGLIYFNGLDAGITYSVKLIDVMGKCVLESVINDQNQSLDLSGFEDGIYFVQIKNGENVHSEKLILNRK